MDNGALLEVNANIRNENLGKNQIPKQSSL
jgi:hypothetical protein